MHKSVFELSLVNLSIFAVNDHHFGRILFLFFDRFGLIDAVFESVFEGTDVFTSIAVPFSALAMRSVVFPLSFVSVTVFVDEGASSC